VRLAKPNYGLITNVGKAHLKGLDRFENVIRASVSCTQYIRESGGKVFVNKGQPTWSITRRE